MKFQDKGNGAVLATQALIDAGVADLGDPSERMALMLAVIMQGIYSVAMEIQRQGIAVTKNAAVTGALETVIDAVSRLEPGSVQVIKNTENVVKH